MLKNKLNRKFRQIIALSTLAALGCSSNLIQSVKEEQDVDDLILSLTQKDRNKLLELMRNHEIVEAKTIWKTQVNGHFKRREKVVDLAEVDIPDKDLDNWIGTSLIFESGSEKVVFGLLKGKKDKHIYLLPDYNASGNPDVIANFLDNYEQLKGTYFDPRKHERMIWKKPKTFVKFCENLEENKFGMSPTQKVVAGVGVAVGVLGMAAYAINNKERF